MNWQKYQLVRSMHIGRAGIFTMKNTTHRWQFVRCGGVDQVTIRDGADIAALGTLDQKLWVALACPVDGLRIDAKTLALVDLDQDGRIRVPDLLGTIKWLEEGLCDLDVLVERGETLALSAIHNGTQIGEDILIAAQRVLDEQGQSSGKNSKISLSQVQSYEQQFAARRYNGDGILIPDGQEAAIGKLIEEIMATHGSVIDRSGKPGVDQARIDAFFAEAKTLCDWQRKPSTQRDILVLGEHTAAASALVRELAAKVDDYFTRCRLASFDGRATASLSGTDAEYLALATKELSVASQDVAKLPLAKIEADRPLPLVDGLNPAWRSKIAELAVLYLDLFGKQGTVLSEAEWLSLCGKLAPFAAWNAEKPQTKLDGLSAARLEELVTSSLKAKLDELVKKDSAAAGEYTQLMALQKLLLLQRDFVALLHNFVNFFDFYNRRGASFLAGSLYLDGRRCDLCVKVQDPGKHAVLASLSKCYLVYADCVRSGGEKLSIVAAITDGNSDHVMVGRNGVFYDHQGRDWDATVTKIIDNPISIRQAFWAPYKSFLRLVEEQVAKRAAAADAESNAMVKDAATKTAAADQSKEDKPDPKAPPKKMDIGTVAALGVAVGGIATFFTSILALFFGLGPWMPLGILALLLSISLPSMLIAWLKLRLRSLGPILDGNGWAVNSLVRINVPFGASLTSLSSIPLGSDRSLRDPYAEKQRPLTLYVVLLAVLALAVAWSLGKVDAYLPAKVQRATVLGTKAATVVPATQAPDKK